LERRKGGLGKAVRGQIINLLMRHPDVTYQEIADLTGVSKEWVHQIARKAGLRRDTKPRHYRSDITIERVLQLYRRNLLVKDIAQTLGCARSTVTSRLRAAGISTSECYSRSMKLDWRGRSSKK